MNRARARCTSVRSPQGSPMGIPGRRREGTSPRPEGVRLSKPTRPTWAKPRAWSGSPNSSRNLETAENSSTGPHRRRPRRVMASRRREPRSSGQGYSPAITKVLIHVPQVGAGLTDRVARTSRPPPVRDPPNVNGNAMVSGSDPAGTARSTGRVSAPGGPAAAGGPQMTERTTGPKSEVAQTTGLPLVLHVIPTTVARGAQLEARALADQLDRPGVRVHRVLSLFDGPAEVVADLSLGHRGDPHPGSVTRSPWSARCGALWTASTRRWW